MAALEEILEKLKSAARPDQLAGMARFGISTDGRLGLSMPLLRSIGKDIGKNQKLSLQLWKSGIQEARILASLVGEPGKVTEKQMEDWVRDFNSWDICDQVCMNLFSKTPLAGKMVREWSKRKEEYVKRAAFTLIACIVWHQKDLSDRVVRVYLSIIRREACDERNYVKKAVNWALRHIGKRSVGGNKEALKLARELLQMESKAARWNAKDAIRELESEAVQRRLKI